MKLRYLAGYSTSFLVLYNRIRFLLTKKDIHGCLRILMYHHIPENKLELFKQQIFYLASNYKFLTPSQFLEFVQGKYYISGINLLITFDDGFKSNRKVAEEILTPLGIKGVFFVSTEFIDLQDTPKQKEFISQKIFGEDAANTEISVDMEPLTWKDLEYLLAQGHIIGSHGRNHRRLSSIHLQQDIYDEIIESGNILEQKLGVPINYFAYPFGDVNSISKHTMNLIKKRYKYCFSGVRGANYFPVPNYAILRDSVSIDDPPKYVQLIIENGLDVIYRKAQTKLLTLTCD